MRCPPGWSCSSRWWRGLAALEAAREARARGGAAERWFFPLFHLFVFTMLAAVTTDDVGIMWVAIEGTTLASVFLVNAERSRESLEAAYKYLLICSVGIALAFVGTVLLYFGDIRALGHAEHALRWTALRELAPSLPAPLVHVAFVFLARGLRHQGRPGPDAHLAARRPQRGAGAGERAHVGRRSCPSGSTPCCASRPWSISRPGPASRRACSWRWGCCPSPSPRSFWRSANFKRMLAYSSVEHVGIVCVGLGFGGAWGGGRRHAARGEPRARQGDALRPRRAHPRRVRLGADRPCAGCAPPCR